MRILSLILALLLCSEASAAIVPSIPYNLTNGSLADATQVMGNFNTIVTDVNANAATSGANTNITSLTGLTTPIAASFGGTVVYTGGTTGGAANAQTLASVTPSAFILAPGNIVTGIAGFTNTAATTFNVNSTGVTAMRVSTGAGLAALTGNEIFAGNSYTWYYDGTFYILLNPSVIKASNIPVSVALAGSPTTTTQATSDNSTKLATTAYVQSVLPTAFVKTVKQQTFTSSGTYTPCTGLLYNVTEVLAGGGGGGAGSAGNFTSSGGGGGGYAKKVISAATVGSSQTITVGAAGSTATNGGTGGTGGTSSFGAVVSCGGGTGGANGSFTAGGSGGTCSGGDINIPGNQGGAAQNASPLLSGAGANSFYGAGGAAVLNTAAVGNNASGYGAGGSGSISNNTSGAGAGGLIYITEYCTQ